MKRKEEKEPNKYNSQNKIIEEQKIDEEDEDPNLNTTVTGSMKHYKKMETANLSTLPALISLKNKPQKEKIEEEKGEDKKLWVPDDHSQNCYNCGSKFFSLLNRRHHCRVCGNIFCKSCLESFCEITIYGEKKELKVCTYCQEKKGELNNILKNNLVEYRNDKGNKIFETKSWDYIKNKKKNQNEIDKFCGFNNIENTALSKFHHDINKNYEKLLEKMIIKVLNENSDKTKYPNLASDWAKVIFNLTKTVINNVSPSFNDLNDSININDYIKIKVIKYLDQSKCEVIDGYAMQKNVCSKKMRIDINNPKILLLKGSLEGIRIGRGNNITDALIVKSVAVEDYIEIIRKKIEKIQPQIIMVEGNASQKYQDFFSTDKMNISLITKCNIKKLNKIARCVNSFVVPSPDLIGKQVVLGSCAKFKVQTIKNKLEINRNELFMRAEEYNLMRFEGCGKILFNTIILSGPNIEELKELKRLMKIITKTARYLYCQKFILKYFNMYYEPSLFGDNSTEKKSKINKVRKTSINKYENYDLGFDTEILDENLNEFECIYMNMHINRNKNETPNAALRASVGVFPVEQEKNQISPKESYVLKTVPQQCLACSYTMNAYSSNALEEKTLGNYIYSFLEEARDKKCEKCSDSKFNHTVYLYKNNGRIKLSVFNLAETQSNIDKVSDFLGFYENSQNKEIKENSSKKIGENISNETNNDIYSYGYCEECNRIVTPIAKLPNEILNFSATKYLQSILFNKKLINFGEENKNILNFSPQKTDLEILIESNDVSYICQQKKHLHYKIISRIFLTKLGALKFQYEDIIKYKLLGSQLNVKNDYYINYHKAKKIEAIALDKALTLKVLEIIKNKFFVHKSMLENLKSEIFGTHIEKLKKIIDDSFIRIDDLSKINEQLFGNENDYENIFVYYHHLKKYLIKIMNIKILSNKILKVIKRTLKLVFFEEIEESNRIIKEQEMKAMETGEKNEGEQANNDGNLTKSFRATIKEPKTKYSKEMLDIIPNKSKSFLGRALTQGALKDKLENKNEDMNNSFSKNNNEQISNENKINISSNDNNSSSLSNSGELELNMKKNSSDNNGSNDNKDIDNKENNEDKDMNLKPKISNNINIETGMKNGNVIVDIDEIKVDDSSLNIDTGNDNTTKPNINASLLSDEDKSNSKLIDLSMKRASLSLSQFNTNPEIKEQINNDYKNYFNEINKYILNILELDKNENIKKIISKLNFYDKKHSSYSNLINDEDICSIITYALTSDQYLEAVQIDNKFGLNEIKSEFINNDLSNDDADNDIFCSTSLLYDRDKIKFSFRNLPEEKISQILENELLSSTNKKCIYEVSYTPRVVFNEVFEKKKKKENKNNNSKLNYFHLNQNLYLMNSELNSIKNDLQKITKERFEEFNKKFDFPSIGTFGEEKIQTMELKITALYSRHFESLRILYCSSYFDFLHSIMRSQEWSSVTGGKSKAHFFKSWDERFVVKCLSEMEFKMFIESCFHYFVHNNKYFFFKMPSSLVKVVGAYKIKIKTSKKNIIYCVIMENLNYLLNSKKTNLVTYDLKGSSLNRYIKEKENGRVLMDTNFVEDFCGEPLVLDQKIYTLFLCSISNDTKICRTMGVIDYSLLCVIVDYNDDGKNYKYDDEKDNKIIFNKGDNEANIKYIRLGVLDYFRKYTWDKQLETLGKTIMHKFTAPTVISPKKYDERFFKKLGTYFIGI